MRRRRGGERIKFRLGDKWRLGRKMVGNVPGVNQCVKIPIIALAILKQMYVTSVINCMIGPPCVQHMKTISSAWAK